MINIFDLFWYCESYSKKEDIKYYFDKKSESVVSADVIQDLLKICESNEITLEYDYGYIPLFQVNVVSLEMKYILDSKVEKYIRHFERVPFELYDKEFNTYFDGNDSVICDFESVLRYELIKRAEEWCHEHGILYKKPIWEIR